MQRLLLVAAGLLGASCKQPLEARAPSVSEVSLTVERAPLDLPDTPDRVSALTTLGYGMDSAAPAKSACCG